MSDIEYSVITSDVIKSLRTSNLRDSIVHYDYLASHRIEYKG